MGTFNRDANGEGMLRVDRRAEPSRCEKVPCLTGIVAALGRIKECASTRLAATVVGSFFALFFARARTRSGTFPLSDLGNKRNGSPRATATSRLEGVRFGLNPNALGTLPPG